MFGINCTRINQSQPRNISLYIIMVVTFVSAISLQLVCSVFWVLVHAACHKPKLLPQSVPQDILPEPVWKVSFLHTRRHFIDLKVYAVFRISKNVMLDSIVDKLVTRSCEVLLNFQ